MNPNPCDIRKAKTSLIALQLEHLVITVFDPDGDPSLNVKLGWFGIAHSSNCRTDKFRVRKALFLECLNVLRPCHRSKSSKALDIEPLQLTLDWP